jgi:hypothetical protein
MRPRSWPSSRSRSSRASSRRGRASRSSPSARFSSVPRGAWGAALAGTAALALAVEIAVSALVETDRMALSFGAVAGPLAIALAAVFRGDRE